MENYPNCPKCNSEYTYEDGSLFVCPECAHEWSKESQAAAEEENVIRDVNGNILNDGDAVTVVKYLKRRRVLCRTGGIYCGSWSFRKRKDDSIAHACRI